jgi:hypothetical protein
MSKALEAFDVVPLGDAGSAEVVLEVNVDYGRNENSEMALKHYMTARDARALAKWLTEAADEAEELHEDLMAELEG